jgi:hypothetical protein
MQSRVRNYLEYCFDQENEINDEEVNRLLTSKDFKFNWEIVNQFKAGSTLCRTQQSHSKL